METLGLTLAEGKLMLKRIPGGRGPGYSPAAQLPARPGSTIKVVPPSVTSGGDLAHPCPASKWVADLPGAAREGEVFGHVLLPLLRQPGPVRGSKWKSVHNHSCANVLGVV